MGDFRHSHGLNLIVDLPSCPQRKINIRFKTGSFIRFFFYQLCTELIEFLTPVNRGAKDDGNLVPISSLSPTLFAEENF